MPSLTLEQVAKRFAVDGSGSITAVEKADLTVFDGELMTLVGPSGCGKTTLLRLIAGLETPTEGKILINSQVVNTVAPKDRDVAMVFQNLALYPHMTARENIAFPLKLRKLPRQDRDRRVMETADLLGISHCLERPPRSLSGGERQRVALGRALVRRPKILLLDEPFSHLDTLTRHQMRQEILRLHRHLGATIIFVTHDQGEAMTLGNRVAVMHRGTVVQVTEPLALHREPANLFVAGFMGSPPMNLIPGQLDRRADGCWFRPDGDGAAPLHLLLPGKLSSRLQNVHLNEIVLGWRAEETRLARNDETAPDSGISTFPAHLEHVEQLGAETHIHTTVGSHRIVARVPAISGMRPGGAIHLAVNLEHARLFDRSSGRLIA